MQPAVDFAWLADAAGQSGVGRAYMLLARGAGASSPSSSSSSSSLSSSIEVLAIGHRGPQWNKGEAALLLSVAADGGLAVSSTLELPVVPMTAEERLALALLEKKKLQRRVK